MVYEKPIVVVNEDLAEGVYAASGDCYSVSAVIVQTPELGNDTYCIQMDATHNASHHSGQQIMKIVFNQPVEHIKSGAVFVSGSGSNTLVLTYDYHANNSEFMGLGHLYVKSADALGIINANCTHCNEDCSIH